MSTENQIEAVRAELAEADAQYESLREQAAGYPQRKREAIKKLDDEQNALKRRKLDAYQRAESLRAQLAELESAPSDDEADDPPAPTTRKKTTRKKSTAKASS